MWKQLSTKKTELEWWFTMRKDEVQLPDGRIMHPYYVLEFPSWANALPITKDGEVVLVRQHRHAAGETMLEVPGGLVDPTDENIEAGIRRELMEETGYAFDQVTLVAETFPNPALQNNKHYSFLATGGVKVAEQKLDTNEDIEIVLVTISELERMLMANEIKHALFVSTVFYGLQQLKKG
jgi:ADP-ribose pyrophosphatase